MFNFAPVASSEHRNASSIAAISSGAVTRTVTFCRIRGYHRLPLSPVDSDASQLLFEKIYQGIDTVCEKRHAKRAFLTD
jgi:hypothetical protein